MFTPESALLQPLSQRAPHAPSSIYPCRLVLPVLESHRNGIQWCVSELGLVERKLIPYKMPSEEVHSPQVFLSLEASVAHPPPCPVTPLAKTPIPEVTLSCGGEASFYSAQLRGRSPEPFLLGIVC